MVGAFPICPSATSLAGLRVCLDRSATRLGRVMEDDAERMAMTCAELTHAMAKRDPVIAPRSSMRSGVHRKDHAVALG